MLVGRRPIRIDERHLAIVRAQPCFFCGHRPPSDPHHLVSRRWRESFRDDYAVIPCCRRCHDGVETHGLDAWLSRWCSTAKQLACAIADLMALRLAAERELLNEPARPF